ncbi:DsrE family protein [Sulfuriferula nivalis]|uniref:DsrE family protein n=1 Tax=Sulfuriferula nivalis TaxID=2675298 RepID=A0A809RMQ8_9PROT|nr:DsrE family protein [Sulfuriferula nivalis]BBP02064.1 hypothetical protein SFSGTM_27720 [Sulfuriferula nivalis]
MINITKKAFPILASLLLTAGAAHADYVKPDITHAPYGHQQVVYQINGGDAKLQFHALKNVLNHVTTVEDIDAVIVVHGEGISLLTTKDPEITGMLDKLREKHVKIDVCNNTLKGKNLDWHELYHVEESDIVPSGVAEVGYLQSQHYAYVKP